MIVKTSDHTNASVDQELVLKFVLKEGTNLEISKEDARLINRKLIETLNWIFGDEVYCKGRYRDGFNEKQGEVLTDEYIYEIVAIFEARLYVYDYDFCPGRPTLNNGDPGYPDTVDFEVDYDKSFCLEDVDYDINEVKSELKEIPIIGDYIDLDTVEIDIKEDDWDTIEFDPDSFGDDEYYRD